MNIACIYFINSLSESICTLPKVQSMCAEKNIDLYIYEQQVNENVIDDSEFEYEIEYEDNKIKFSFNYLKRTLNWNYNKENDAQFGSQFLTLLDFFRNINNSYDYYIFYNSKVGYFNDINLFDYFDFENNDAIFTTYRVIYNGIEYNDVHGIDKDIYLGYGGDTLLYALSNKVISYISQFMLNNTELVCQDTYLINTLCMTNDLFKLSYLCNSLSFDIQSRNIDFNEEYFDLKYPIEGPYDLNYFNSINKYDNHLRYGNEN